MVLTQSKKLDLWTIAPDFSLPDTISGKVLSLWDMKWEKGTVLMFICNHCPFVIHINSLLIELTSRYKAKGINFIAISSNDATSYPDDGPEKMAQHAKRLGYNFPYLYDATQEIAQSYSAVCTPDIFFFGKKLELVYHGQLDSSRPGSEIPLSWIDLRKAIDIYMRSWEIEIDQKPSIGCSIKWK